MGAIAVICVGLPVTAWLATRGLGRRPAAPLKPYHGRVESWVHRQYELDWPQCSWILGAVAQGSRAADPALEDAAHRLAAATLAGKVPGVWLMRLAPGVNVVLGLALAALGIGALFWGQGPLPTIFLIPEGASLFALGWHNYVRGAGRQRKNAARALELNQPAEAPYA
ncbi:MAG: hypothetical protein ACR2MP_08210 [Streptosporangiaceae bacterium]